MNGATFANLAWVAASAPAASRFRSALARPRETQLAHLRALVAANRDTAFGREHEFATIRSHDDFARRVPLRDYDELHPWIARTMRGETNVLTAERVSRLVPTSGTSGARKFIPFTAGLQREFNAAIGPWMVDLFRSEPSLLGGPAYWSITPAVDVEPPAQCVLPVGFDDDAAYLGGIRRRLVEAVMAVPSSVSAHRDAQTFRVATLRHLVECRDLRLISVWHPSFLTLLLDELSREWDALVRQIPRTASHALRDADPTRPETIWPRLRVISCWADAHAALAVGDLERRFPGVRVQPKGILATEAVISIPYRGKHPLAVRSHFFEFICDDGRVRLADELHEGETYEVVVTNAGGLWRYRLGDHVQVDGLVEATPSVRFVGRTGNVCDLRGEKLSDAFVTAALRDVLREPARFAMLAPTDDGIGYTLYLESEAVDVDLAGRLECALRENPHYAWCRDLGQLAPLRLFRIVAGGYETFVARAQERGLRLGDIKPAALSGQSGWSRRFAGDYAERLVSRPTMIPASTPIAMPPRP